MRVRHRDIPFACFACLMTLVAGCGTAEDDRQLSGNRSKIAARNASEDTLSLSEGSLREESLREESLLDGTRHLQPVPQVNQILDAVSFEDEASTRDGRDQLQKLDARTRFRGLFFHVFGPSDAGPRFERAAYYITEFIGRDERDARIEVAEVVLEKSGDLLEMAHACRQLSMDYRSVVADEKASADRKAQAIKKTQALVPLQRRCLASDNEAAQRVAFEATTYLGELAEPNRAWLYRHAEKASDSKARERVDVRLSRPFKP